MTFKRGDIISFGSTKLTYVGFSERAGKFIAEHLKSGEGWERDEDIPENYESIGSNCYWFVNPGENWELVKAIENTYEIY